MPGPYRVVIATQKSAPKMFSKTKASVSKGQGPWGFEVEISSGETFTKDFELR